MKVLVIAEAGVNHNGDLNQAFKLVDAAKAAGADFVKFQTFKAANLATKSAPKAQYQKENTAKSESQYEMLKRLELDRDTHVKLIHYCETKGIKFLSTPFDEESLDLLVNDFHVPLIKVPSGELTNGPYLLKIARCKLPVILSTGMGNMDEVKEALGVLAFGFLHGADRIPKRQDFMATFESPAGRDVLKKNVSVLHCTTQYPTPVDDVNLRAIQVMQAQLGVSIGYSDHTMGISVPIAAVALGATVIEKHFTLDRTLEGPDHKASLEPGELKAMIQGIRDIEMALGRGEKFPTPSDLQNIHIARKSLVAAKEIRKGEVIDAHSLVAKRPGTGRSPMDYWSVLGQVAPTDYQQDEVIQ